MLARPALPRALLFLYFATNLAYSQPLVEFSPEEWAEDVRFLAKTIAESHKNPYHTTSKEELDGAIGALESRVAELEGHQIVLEMARIVALIGDGHSGLWPWDSGMLRCYPLSVRIFADGLFVVAAVEGLEHLVQARVLRIGSGEVDGVIRGVAAYVPRDNEWTVKAWSPLMLVMPELLYGLGHVADMEKAEWEFQVEGKIFTETLTPLSMEAYFEWRDGVIVRDDVPSYRRHRERAYWLKYFPEHKTVYMRFNDVRNGENNHLAGFSRDLIDFIDTNAAEYLVIDVRDNGGGNGDLLRPLIRRIAKHEGVNRDGHLYAITNRYTFSAAMMFVTRMERNTHVLFAGEPAGGKPNHYGDVARYSLPNSKIAFRLSPLYHEESFAGDERRYQEVQISVPLRSVDYFGSGDPVLEAVLDAISSRIEDESLRTTL